MQAKDAAFLDSGLKDERYLLNALTALLLCMEQTFTQSSVWGEDLPKAFSAALDVYVASGHIIKIHDAITTILSETQLPLQAVPRTTKLLDKEATEKILVLIVENRLRL
ncbi:hypothetical protein FIBSPDRAFT_867383 [Athelia psychrophila]|uniref:Uncharacterized protein n=1 Tax=Athelia psychrophila TaxID=1759441 RepID=A0A166E1A5_9AGAM|nr:hypothetical protein FIBSPDRAFT_867383 [Fibularhizoctonia sp. CBS 109695]